MKLTVAFAARSLSASHKAAWHSAGTPPGGAVGPALPRADDLGTQFSTQLLAQYHLHRIYEKLEEYDEFEYWQGADTDLQPMVEESRPAVMDFDLTLKVVPRAQLP